MAQQVKALASKPDDLTLVPQTYTMEGENRPSQAVLCSTMGCVLQVRARL